MPKLTIQLGEIDSKPLKYLRRYEEVSGIVLDSSADTGKEIDFSIQKENPRRFS